MKHDFNTMHLLHSIREIPPSAITSSEKYILIMILSCINENNKTWYTMQNLSKYCCMSERRISPHIKSLAQKGFISIEKPLHYARRQSNEYSLNVDQIMNYHISRSHDVSSAVERDRMTKRPVSHDKTSPVSPDKTSDKERNKRKKEEGATKASGEASRPSRPAGWTSYEDLQKDPEYQEFKRRYLESQKMNNIASSTSH